MFFVKRSDLKRTSKASELFYQGVLRVESTPGEPTPENFADLSLLKARILPFRRLKKANLKGYDSKN